MQLSEYEKYKIIFMYEMNNNITYISEQLKINRHTTSKWINRYLNSNMKRIDGSGRPVKCTNDILLAVQNEVISNKYIILKEIKENISKNNMHLSLSTIKKILNDNNYTFIYPPKKFPLSDVHKINRLKFAIKYLNFDWSKVIFTDEVSFWMLKNPPKRWCNRNIQEDCDILFKHSYKFNVWGGICINETFELNIFTSIMDTYKYIDILKTNFIQKYNDELYFQFDNDPKHTSLKAKNFIKKYKIKTIEHPPCSPDLNPIENIWSILKKRLSKYQFKTVEEFKNKIIEEWNKIDKEIIRNTILSMKIRLQMIIDNKGGYINY